MLKILMLLERDVCKALLAKSSEANQTGGLAGTANAKSLEYTAEQNGWSIFHSHHTCDACVIEAQFSQEQAQT